MKIVVTAKDPSPSSQIDPRFGRTAFLLLFDTENDHWETVDNTSANSAEHGAGVQAAQTVCGLGADVVITGDVGPKAFAVLAAGGVKVYRGGSRTALNAVEAFQQKQLQELQKPDVSRVG